MLFSFRDWKEGNKTDTQKQKGKYFQNNKRICSFTLVVFLFGGLTLCRPSFIYAEAIPPLPNSDVTIGSLGWTIINGTGTQLGNLDTFDGFIADFGSNDFTMVELLDTGIYDIINIQTGTTAGLDIDTMVEHIGDTRWLQENGYEFRVNESAWENKALNASNLAKQGAEMIHNAVLGADRSWYYDFGRIGEIFLNNAKFGYELLFTDPDTGETIVETFQSMLENVLDYFEGNIDYGVTTNASIDINKAREYGNVLYNWGRSGTNSRIWTVYYQDGIYFYCMKSTTVYYFEAYNASDSSKLYSYRINNGNFSNQSIVAKTIRYQPFGSGGNNNWQAQYNRYITVPVFESSAERDAWIATLGSVETGKAKISPDLANINTGNLSADNKANVLPAVQPDEFIQPIPPQIIRRNIEEINTNFENENAEDNGLAIEEYVNPYIQQETLPQPTVAPGEDPWQETYPVPGINDVPAIIDQPEFPEEPNLDDNAIDESLQFAMPDLKDIFPFCLPWDIYDIFQKFRAERRAPAIDWDFESDLYGFSYHVHLDLEDFDVAAEIFRLLFLIAFIVGLAVATRKLIGA